MIESTVEVTLNSRNAKYFKDLGYKLPQDSELSNTKLGYKRGAKIKVHIKDLSPGSKVKIKRTCDRCSKVDLVGWRDLGSKELCGKCSKSDKTSGKNNPMYGVSIPNPRATTAAQKYGNCIDCGKVKSSKKYSRCDKCSGKSIIGSNNPMYGKTHTEETKAKLRQSSLKLRHTDDAKIKISLKKIEPEFLEFIRNSVIEDLKPPFDTINTKVTVSCVTCSSDNRLLLATLKAQIKNNGWKYNCRDCATKLAGERKSSKYLEERGFNCEVAFLNYALDLVDKYQSSCADTRVYETLNTTPSHLVKLINKYGRTEYFYKYQSVSAGEAAMQDFVKSILPESELKFNYRPDFLGGKELDIFIPAKNLAIEFNGNYWHSDKMQPDKNYHRQKYLDCKEAGIQLLQIYESEWNYKRDIVCGIIKAKLGMLKVVGARKCVLQPISAKIGSEFLTQTHLMGPHYTAKHLGLFYEGTLISVLSYKKVRSGVDISRYSSSLGWSVMGGLSKFLKHIKRTENPEFIQSYVDLRYGTGESLLKTGFELAGTTLGWKWTDFNETFNRRKCRANMDSRGLSEAEYAAELGWSKIYDAGQAKFVTT